MIDLQEEFSRAVHICTGKHLSRHMVHTGGSRIKHTIETNFSCWFSFPDFRRWRRRPAELPGVCCHDEGQDPPRTENPQQARRLARLQTMRQAGDAGVQLEQIPSLIEYIIDPLCPWGCCHCQGQKDWSAFVRWKTGSPCCCYTWFRNCKYTW